MKKSSHALEQRKTVTIAFGYVLFFALLITIAISTVIPWTALLFSPTVMHFNVIMLVASLVAGAVLPVLLAYFIGSWAAYGKDTTSRRYEGVLYAIVTYWLSLLLGIIGADTVATIRNNFAEPLATLINAWPILATTLVMAMLAIIRRRANKKDISTLRSWPYQIALTGAVVAFLAYLATHQDYDDNHVAYGIVSLFVPVALTFCSFFILPHKGASAFTRLTGALVAMSMGVVATFLTGQLTSYSNLSFFTSMITCQLVGLTVWAAYLWIITRR